VDGVYLHSTSYLVAPGLRIYQAGIDPMMLLKKNLAFPKLNLNFAYPKPGGRAHIAVFAP
jgi:hypothetical protein